MLHDREAYQFGGYNNRGQFGGYLLLYSDLPSFARRLFIVISFFVTQKKYNKHHPGKSWWIGV